MLMRLNGGFQSIGELIVASTDVEPESLSVLFDRRL